MPIYQVKFLQQVKIMNDWQQLYDLESNRFRRVIVKFSIETLSKAFKRQVFEKMLNALKSNGQRGKQKAYLLQDHMQIVVRHDCTEINAARKKC